MNHSMENNIHHRLLEQLSERLAATERSLASAHAEIAQLQRRSRPSWGARCSVVALGVLVMFATTMSSRFATIHAQESGQRVSAPFEVVGSDGQYIFRVKDFSDGPQACLKSSTGFSCLATTGVGGLVMTGRTDGKPKASLGVDNNGDGGLILWDAGGKPMADILVGPKGGRGLAVYDSGGNQKVLVSTTSQAVGQVLVDSEGNTPAVGMVAGKAGSEGSRGAFVYDDSGNSVAEMIVNSEGIGALRALETGEGGGSAVLFAEQDIGGVLRVRGEQGKVVGEVTENGFNYFGSGGNPTSVSRLGEEGGRGVVGVYSKGNTPLAFLTESDKSGGGNVTIADPGGNGVFSAGYVAGGGADACLDLPKQGLKCFGIGLPMTFSVSK